MRENLKIYFLYNIYELCIIKHVLQFIRHMYLFYYIFKHNTHHIDSWKIKNILVINNFFSFTLIFITKYLKYFANDKTKIYNFIIIYIKTFKTMFCCGNLTAGCYHILPHKKLPKLFSFCLANCFFISASIFFPRNPT